MKPPNALWFAVAMNASCLLMAPAFDVFVDGYDISWRAWFVCLYFGCYGLFELGYQFWLMWKWDRARPGGGG